MRTHLVVLCLAIAPTLAFAENLPRYDPDGWCSSVASMGGGTSETIRQACMEQEQTAYDNLKSTWANIPGATRDWCDQVARSGSNGTYVILEACIEQESQSKQKNDATQFKF